VVSLIGLLSSVITVAQVMITVTLFVKHKMPRTDKERHRLSVGVALVSISSVVVVSVVTWSGVLAAAARIGDGGVNGVLYALIAPTLGLAVAFMLLVDALQKDRRFFRFATCLIVGCIALMIGMDLAVRNVGWGGYLILAAESGMVCATLLFHFIDQSQPKDSGINRRPRASAKLSSQAEQ
jgi:hypothetical protein